ncbi:MAG: radical SAM protein, partial [Deltaproteobacteria bacterium]|nr:radical SAM protein [Deltaproteobacteria bacterium]
PGPELGFFNLAVFYKACSFNCLFCQNWHFKEQTWLQPPVSAAELAAAAGPKTTCICYFGGDPSPQIVHSLAAARLAREAKGDDCLRICWETNGSFNPKYLDQMIDLALESGGCLKFDLKAFSPGLHRALCGVGNDRTLANFAAAARHFERRPQPPLLVAATLLVPGYVTPEEVGLVARFMAKLNPDIPYALLAFHPDFYLDDLPTTSRQHAQEALEAAKKEGLSRVRLGNVHLLGRDY